MKRREMEMHPDYHALLLNNEQRHGASGSTPTLIHRIQWLDYSSTITAFFLLEKIAIANKENKYMVSTFEYKVKYMVSTFEYKVSRPHRKRIIIYI